MSLEPLYRFSQEVREALAQGRPLVALESTVIAHGLPYPANIETALEMEAAVREAGATPAMLALMKGQVLCGLSRQELEALADPKAEVRKVSRRDIASCLSEGSRGATTVSGSITLAARAGLKVFATGGIGGVHPGAAESFDVSADLQDLSREALVTVASGAKSILDLPATLESLETLGVPVIGYGSLDFPAFYSRQSGLSCSAKVESAEEAAALAARQFALKLGGLLLCNPIPQEAALPLEEVEAWTEQALEEAAAQQIEGKAVTPFLLARLRDLSGQRTLTANRALLLANARLAGELAVALSARSKSSFGG